MAYILSFGILQFASLLINSPVINFFLCCRAVPGNLYCIKTIITKNGTRDKIFTRQDKDQLRSKSQHPEGITIFDKLLQPKNST
jgi:hypothetical protein